MLGRTGSKYEIASVAPALRSCFLEYRVPKLNRRSHGVFVSEMPQETEEEDTDEEISSDGLDDVEKSLMKMTTATLFWRKTKSERCWRRRRHINDKKSQKKDYAEVSENQKKSATTPVTRKFRAEIEELKLRTKCDRCGNVETLCKNVHKSRRKAAKKAVEKPTLEEQRALCQEDREMRISSTGVLEMNHVFGVSSRADTAPCWKGFADAANNVVRCWIQQRC